ncbi:LysR family transcriptional regulator [Actinoplanes oblitus]|uniref:LysR family transcriptional regulator n=1 Tax=Actinoplanes oblitus TaxID=3040509 RepID=A0ABY8W9T2_9ACTN|nr:LysR family transcriptional regulator [Actinoplanes oblitus]WIM93886.1 LysR family transcriptional regulator [Actinoplanes oblitus]
MEFRQLRTFRVVARTLNLTRAAAELHYAQSSVTEQIQALEADLGTPLFERGGRRLRLTAAGQRLISYADQLLLLAEEARVVVREDAGEPSGELAVGALETLCAQRLPGVLSAYRARWPRVRVSVREANRGELYAAVRRGELDVSLTFGEAPRDEALGTAVVGTERLMVVTPPGHALAGAAELTPGELAGEPFVATQVGCGFREMLDRSGLGSSVVAELGSLAALSGCVAAGMGLALLPESAVRGVVAAVPLREAVTPVTLTWLRRWESRPAVAAFLTAARAA